MQVDADTDEFDFTAWTGDVATDDKPKPENCDEEFDFYDWTSKNDLPLTEEQIRRGIITYNKQLARIRRYNEKHRAEIYEKNRLAFRRMKQDPERYEVYKRDKRVKIREDPEKYEIYRKKQRERYYKNKLAKLREKNDVVNT